MRRLLIGVAVLPLSMALVQSPPATAKPASVSVKAPLPASAYAGLACDVADPRLKKTALSNGVGPEARVAAACWRLEWLSQQGTMVPPITVHASPGFPAWLVKRITNATKAGHRLFGRFGDVRTYEVIASVDPAYSCSTGARLFDPRNDWQAWGLRSWSEAWNSGCAGADYNPGSWHASVLGDGRSEYISWTLIHPRDKHMLTDTNLLGPTWFMGASSHEFVHSVQAQRALATSPTIETPGRWYTEGQAMYLGHTAAGYTIGPKNVRGALLNQLRDFMREEGITEIDLVTLDMNPRTRIIWPAGYFAYEWLVAHYGIEATFDWWNEWNTDCAEPGQRTCWRTKAPALLGMDADTLMDTLDAYVNAQVRR